MAEPVDVRFSIAAMQLSFRAVLFLAFCGLLGFAGQLAWAQPPGTPPPSRILSEDQESRPEGLPIRAFMFLSESGNRVMMPSLSWEEFERFLNLDAGMDAARQKYSYQSLQIDGTSDQERAELDVTLRFSVEPTEGRWISIPLRMGNFHRLAPPDVSGVDEYFMALAPDDTGYLLFVKTDKRSKALLRMRVSSRVEIGSAAQTLSFRLPDVPAKVELVTDANNALGEVIGRGNEAIKVESMDGRRTRISVDSGGRDFAVRWGRLERSTDNVPVLEVDSRTSVRWESPEDPPVATVRLTIKNVRGSIDSFQLRLPTGSVVLDTPRLGASGQAIELGAVVSDRSGEVREVSIPKEERQQRISLNFDLQLANDNADANSPLIFRVPEVVGALRHRGDIDINTGGDYRLRWLTTSWIRSELGESREDATSGRSYRFHFDRASFALPLWLGEKERQLRLNSRSEITIREGIASLLMNIEINGQTADGRLRFDDATWQVQSIESETDQPLDSFTEDGFRVIEFNASGTEETARLRVRAQKPLDALSGAIGFPLPRVVEVDDSALVQDATVDLVNRGRTVLVVDLDASKGISRVPRTTSGAGEDTTVTTFQLVTQGSAPQMIGKMIEQPPRVILASDATIELDGQQLRSTVDWSISSGLDLEGSLPIRIPSIPPPSSVSDPDLLEEALLRDVGSTTVVASDARTVGSSADWVVTVDDIPAQLEALGEDRFVLISDRLSSGAMDIRWRHVRKLRSRTVDGSIEPVTLPRPDFADVTVRGPVRITLRGNQQLDLVSLDSPSISDVELAQLPREPVRLRLRSRLTAREELSIRQTILRTVVGHKTRHEQVLATIQGGDSFRVGLPEGAGEVSVQALIDGVSESVRREGNTLIVMLPGDSATHVVDLRVWLAVETSSSVASIEPTLRLPVGVGRVYWQIVAPLDGHIVWASPTLGRSMSWRFDRWRLFREPTHDDQALARLAGATANPLPPGNRYLYLGSDLRSFRAIIISRVVLWLCIGAFVLTSAVVLTNLPRSRHPLTAVAMAVLFGGLLAIAPDAAVLAGQFGIIAMVLVIVMIAVRSLISPTVNDRVFSSSGGPVRPSQPSTRSMKNPIPAEPVGQASTEAVPPPATEAPS
ncbi:MAG: hypothetical protein ACR2NZ_18880 [Rubripirellula sp.]